jgi:hypothetical protein
MKRSSESFVFCTDIHFWEFVINPFRLFGKRALGTLNLFFRRRKYFRMERLREYSSKLLSRNAGSLLIGGDLSTTSTNEEFVQARDFLNSLGYSPSNLHLVPGNHDVYTFRASAEKRFEKHFAEWIPGGGYPCMTSMENGTPLLMLSTVCPNVFSSRGNISDSDIARVSEMLSAVDSDIVVVVSHYPLLTEAPQYSLSRSRRLQGAESLRNALGTCGRKVIYLCGHVHRFSSNIDPLYPNIHQITGPSFVGLSPKTGLGGGFVECTIGLSEYVVEHHFLADEWNIESETHLI